MTDVTWDYTELAPYYDKRGDYADEAIDAMFALMTLPEGVPLADIGAGTGKLTKMLLARGHDVLAVEPNDAMRGYGIRNTAGGRVQWRTGTGEQTGLADHSVSLAAFGSSFNVTDRMKALHEVARIVRPRGWFACLWNHRDLEDEQQQIVEKIIHDRIPGYGYGSRREDQTKVIRESGLFEEPRKLEGRTAHVLSSADFIDGWKSHATLQRQAGDAFPGIIREIERACSSLTTIRVPYITRLWCARRTP